MTEKDKKRVLGLCLNLWLLLIIITVVLISTGCSTARTYQEAVEQAENEKTICGGYFVVITSWKVDITESYYIVYAQDTNVKYLVKQTGYQFGITPLYNADGTLQVYEEAEEQPQQ